MASLRVALLMDTARAYEQGILRGISQYSLMHGPWQFFRKMPQVSGGEAEIRVHQIEQWGAQGLIVREGLHRQALFDLDLPTVMVPFSQPYPEYTNILTHDQAIGRMGAEHLLSCGFRHFAYVGLGSDFYFSRGRQKSFCQAITDAGHPAETINLPLQGQLVNWGESQECLQHWLKALPKPTGLMACNDDICLHVIEACKAVNIAIPDEIGLIGVGNDEMICTLTSPPLSSIALSTEKAGFVVSQWLEDKTSQSQTPARNIFVEPIHVIARQSTNVLMIDDEEIKKTVRFILDHAHQGISVSDVLTHVPMSRSALYERFREVMGHSLYDYIRHTRMEHAARLLIETDLPIGDIARAVGFQDQKNISRHFRQAMGKTPLQYRRSYRVK